MSMNTASEVVGDIQCVAQLKDLVYPGALEIRVGRQDRWADEGRVGCTVKSAVFGVELEVRGLPEEPGDGVVGVLGAVAEKIVGDPGPNYSAQAAARWIAARLQVMVDLPTPPFWRSSPTVASSLSL